MRHSHSRLRTPVIIFLLVLALLMPTLGPAEHSARQAIIKVRSEAAAKDMADQYDISLVDSIPELSRYLVTGGPGDLAKLRKDGRVLSTEDNALVEISETAMLNESTVALLDPSTVALLDGQGKLWDYQHPGDSSMLRQPALQKIQFTPWNVVYGDSVTVAVIDTGVDPLHEMLLGSTLPGKNFIDERRNTDELMDLDPQTAALLLEAGGRTTLNGTVVSVLNPSTVALLDSALAKLLNGRPSLYFGHGTMVSSLIHALAPSARILPLKVFDMWGRATSFRIAKAVVFAATNGARVLNMSFSLDTQSPLVQDALTYAKNTVLVASIGNDNSKVDKNYPASYGKVLGIAATDLNDRKTAFSNYGPVADVSAPGEGLISAYPGGLYAVWSGTSAASALVSGESALLLSRKDWKSDELIKRLIDSVDPLHDRYDLGKGRINLKTALDKIK